MSKGISELLSSLFMPTCPELSLFTLFDFEIETHYKISYSHLFFQIGYLTLYFFFLLIWNQYEYNS